MNRHVAGETGTSASRGSPQPPERSRGAPPKITYLPLIQAVRCASQNLRDEVRRAPGDRNQQFLETIAVAVERCYAGLDFALPLEVKNPPGRRLVKLLRRSLVGVWDDSGCDEPVTDVVRWLRAVETVRDSMDPMWDREFAESLMGADGLELVVEVAHDLRSPLTSILFLAETLQRGHSGDVTDLQHRQLGLVYSAALGLSTMASNVIEMARGGSRLAEDNPAPFSTEEIFESVRDIVRPMVEEKQLSLRMLPPSGDYRVGHPQALSRVLLNLTSNAIKFTEEGFVEIVGQATGLSRVEFSVRDTGPGMTDEKVALLYQPFRQATAQNRQEFSGTGLGLALSRRLVELMGGKLDVDTRPGWGTRFYFELALPTAPSG